MELDFSARIKALFESKAHEKTLEKEIDRNDVLAKMESSLAGKVESHNERFKDEVSLAQLKKVFRRGLVANVLSHCPSQCLNGWAMARVNEFLKMKRGENVEASYASADKDIASGNEEYYNQSPEDCFWGFQSIDFDLARIDLIKASVDIETEGNVNLFDIDYSPEERGTLNKPYVVIEDSEAKFAVDTKNQDGEIVCVKFGGEKASEFSHLYQTSHARYTPEFWVAEMLEKKIPKSLEGDEFLLGDGDGLEWSWKSDLG